MRSQECPGAPKSAQCQSTNGVHFFPIVNNSFRCLNNSFWITGQLHLFRDPLIDVHTEYPKKFDCPAAEAFRDMATTAALASKPADDAMYAQACSLAGSAILPCTDKLAPCASSVVVDGRVHYGLRHATLHIVPRSALTSTFVLMGASKRGCRCFKFAHQRNMEFRNDVH